MLKRKEDPDPDAVVPAEPDELDQNLQLDIEDETFHHQNKQMIQDKVHALEIEDQKWEEEEKERVSALQEEHKR